MEKKRNLILFLNRRCTVGCPSCNADASANNSAELSVPWLETFFQQIHELQFSRFIIWTGGEPFLSFQALQKGISLAAQNNYHSEILTSGAWFQYAPEQLEDLAAIGDFSLRISLDAEHQDTVPLPTVICLIKKALGLHIEVNFTLREIPGRKEFAKNFLTEIKEQLPDFYHENHTRSRWLHHLPHMPITTGPGCLSSPSTTAPGKQKWKQNCKMGFKDLVIGEDRLIYPCCGLFGIPGHEQLALGDPVNEPWETLDTRQHKHPLFQILREKGPYGICRALGLTPETWNWPAYETPCHLCLALFHLYKEQVYEYYLKRSKTSTFLKEGGAKNF
jgi:organic radical activating enzyme